MTKQKTLMRRQDAFTLVELLVAMAIFSTILVLVMSALRTGSNALTTIVGEADIIEDARAASAIIADEINQAAYIYPPGSTLTLGTAGYTTINPNTGNRTWTVGDDPILAMITVPDTNEGNCADDPDFCYTFVAYYPVERSEVSDNVPYLADAVNDNGANAKWVLYEYRSNLDVGASSESFYETYYEDGEAIPTNFGGVAAQILVDYVIPDSLAVNIDEDNACYPGDTTQNEEYFVGNAPCESVNTNSDIYASVAIGEFVFQSGRTRRGRDYRSPEIRFSLAPLNLHNPLTDRQIYAN